jgi:hypothetical protein
MTWFNTPSFTQQEAADIAGISYGQLRQWNSRDQMQWIKLPERGRPGSRRLYSAEDILVIRTVMSLKSVGIPITSGTIGAVAMRVTTRAAQLIKGFAFSQREGSIMVYVPQKDGVYSGGQFFEFEELPELLKSSDLGDPNTFIIFQEDKIIKEVIETTMRLIRGEQASPEDEREENSE